MAKIDTIEIPKLLFDEGAAPGTPASTNVAVYAKADGLMYSKDDAGTETLMSGGGGGLGAWTDYTPALTAVTTNPTLGSSTIAGRYKALDANTYAFVVNFTVTTGGAWNAGSGEYKFSLPSVTSGTVPQVVAVHLLDAGAKRYVGSGLVSGSSTVVWPIAISDASGTFILSHNVPITWATGDNLVISGLIEVV